SGTIEQPLLIPTPHGFGQILFVPLAIDMGPLAAWKRQGKFLARLLTSTSDERRARVEESAGGGGSHLRYNDLSGLLRVALDRFPGVTLVPFSLVVALMACYVILIGPIDYFLLRRFGNMTLTWLSFPLLVAAFCVLAFYLA